jgi:phage host-nuclease inhibitor protein Gam
MYTEEIPTETENAFDIEPEQDAPALRPQFCIDSDSAAEWLLRLLVNNAAEKIRITAQAQDMIAALEADSGDLMFKYGAALEHYCREKLAQEGNRRKSVRFLQGTCAFRWQGPAMRLKDTAAALTWCKENAPALVAVETLERVDTEAFRQQAERLRSETGELLPGVEYSEGGDSFSLSFPTEVKPKKAKK